jgi:hypothetical protein
MKQSERQPAAPHAASASTAKSRDLEDYAVPRDPLFRDPVLPHAVQVSVLGIRVRLRTNDRRVLGMFQAAFGTGIYVDAVSDDAGHVLERRRSDDALQLNVQVVVYDGATHDSGLEASYHICPDPVRVLIHGNGGMAISDPLRREALIYATDGLVRNETHFRNNFLEAATLALVTHFDRQPIHAAAIMHDGRVLLLIGPSGAGKSTLSYIARAAGLGVLSEDIAWMQLTPKPVIWGRPQAIHLLPGSENHFPELRPKPASRRPNGKQKITVDIEQLGSAGQSVANEVVACLLQPGRGDARVARVERDELYVALTRDAAAGFDRYPERRAECAHVLAARGGWSLTLSNNPRDALPLLKELLTVAT